MHIPGVQNPIITVTEHTPTPSPDFMRRQGSIDSQLDALSLSGEQLGIGAPRKTSLTRSQTDSNITYLGEEMPEAPGSISYISKDGDLDFEVILKAVHAAAMHDNSCCSLRVIEVILNLVEILMDLGVLKQCLRDEAHTSCSNLQNGQKTNKSSQSFSQMGNKDDTSVAGGSYSGQAGSVKGAGTSSISERDGNETVKEELKPIEKIVTPHYYIMNILVR